MSNFSKLSYTCIHVKIFTFTKLSRKRCMNFYDRKITSIGFYFFLCFKNSYPFQRTPTFTLTFFRSYSVITIVKARKVIIKRRK